MTAGAFLRIRVDVDSLRDEKEKHIDLVQKFMKSVVTHEDMQAYIEDIKSKLVELNELKQIQSKEKWKKYHMAFGGKEEEKE